jgi:hypothetical protein
MHDRDLMGNRLQVQPARDPNARKRDGTRAPPRRGRSPAPESVCTSALPLSVRTCHFSPASSLNAGYNCGKKGHFAKDCSSGDWSTRCYRCGQRGMTLPYPPLPPAVALISFVWLFVGRSLPLSVPCVALDLSQSGTWYVRSRCNRLGSERLLTWFVVWGCIVSSRKVSLSLALALAFAAQQKASQYVPGLCIELRWDSFRVTKKWSGLWCCAVCRLCRWLAFAVSQQKDGGQERLSKAG